MLALLTVLQEADQILDLLVQQKLTSKKYSYLINELPQIDKIVICKFNQ